MQAAVVQAGVQAVAPVVAAVKAGDPRLDSIRQHLQRYRDLVSQGKMADAGRELDAIQNEVSK
jgi:hypothetical protein